MMERGTDISGDDLIIKEIEGTEYAEALVRQFDDFHSLNPYDDGEIELEILQQKYKEVEALLDKTNIPKWVKGVDVRFSPSSAGSCNRELYYKALRAEKDVVQMYPYQKRWTLNGSAIHERVQRDILYMEKYLDNPEFVVERDEEGFPMWEFTNQKQIVINHKEETFALFGKSDGILRHVDTGKLFGFEVKTKSTTSSALGPRSLPRADTKHKTQQIGYAMLYGVRDFIIFYESLAKDWWGRGAEAKADTKAFIYKVEDEDIFALLDKFADVAKAVRLKELPPKDEDKCIFCPYKTLCGKEWNFEDISKEIKDKESN
jgi:CRISPR/Cas system-associated exonuclease Cas4 (RecB family)